MVLDKKRSQVGSVQHQSVDVPAHLKSQRSIFVIRKRGQHGIAGPPQNRDWSRAALAQKASAGAGRAALEGAVGSQGFKPQ